MKYIQILCVAVCLFIASPGHAQTNDNDNDNRQRRQTNEGSSDTPSLKDRIRVGGNFSFQLGNATFIDVSPFVTYMVTERFNVSAGATYQYIRFRIPGFPGGENSIYGGRVFARQFILPSVFAHAEYETLNTVYPFFDGNVFEYRRGWVPAGFIGGGYNQSAGRRAAFQLTILYNLLYDNLRSPYNSPWVIRTGFHF
jgi:hypothetical protein